MKKHNAFYLGKAIKRYELLYNYDDDLSAYELLITRALIHNNRSVFFTDLSVKIFVELLAGSGEEKQFYKYDPQTNHIKISSNPTPTYNPITVKRSSKAKNHKCQKVDWAIQVTQLILGELDKQMVYMPVKSMTDISRLLIERAKEKERDRNIQIIQTLMAYILENVTDESTKKLITDNSDHIFFNICKSILVGEYLYDDEYSSRLNKLISPDDKHTLQDDTAQIDNIVNARLEYNQVFRKIQRFCYTLKNVICPCNPDSDIAAIGIDGYINRRDAGIHCHLIESLWVDLLNAILNITFIDFVFVTNISNLRALNTALENINLVSYKWENRTEVQEEIIGPIKEKLRLLMTQMLNQGVIYDEHNSLLPQYYFVDYKSTSLFAPKDSDKDSLYKRIDYIDFKDKFSEYSSLEGYNDLNNYNSFCNEIFRKHLKQSQILLAIDLNDIDSSETILDLINQYIQDSNNIYTAPFLYYTISYLDKYSQEAISNRDTSKLIKSISLSNILLGKLSIYIEKHKSGMAGIHQVRDYFQNSIYELKDGKLEPLSIMTQANDIDYTAHEHTSIVSFVSYKAKPINIPFLINFLNHYEQETKIIETEIFKQQTEDEFKKVNESIEHERNHSIQTLGLLGSFIAFVSIISTGAANLVNSQTLFIYLVGGALLISLFVALLKFVTPSSPKCKIREGIFVLIMCGCLLGMIYYLKETNIIEKEEQRTEKVKENGHTIIFNQNTNQSNN